MIQNCDYFLGNICGKNRLIACGQANGNLHKDVLLSDTAAYIWDQMETDISMDELVARFQKEYECTTEEEKERAKATVEKFADVLDHSCLMFHPAAQVAMRSFRIESIPEDISESTVTSYFDIADITLALHCPSEIIPDVLKKWEVATPGTGVLQHIYFHLHDENLLGAETSLARTLITEDIKILEDKEKYYISFPLAKFLTQAQMNVAGDEIHIFYTEGDLCELKEEIIQAMGTFFFYLAQKNNLFAIHSASIEYRDRAWLFSAPTGVGKSTHANLWTKNLSVEIFNGDINLLKEENGHIYVIGIPWCGTSGICGPGKIELGGIIFVNQSPSDYVEDLNEEDQIVCLLHRLISPMWKRELGKRNLAFAKKIPASALICKLFCTMENSAMEVMKDRIDTYLE